MHAESCYVTIVYIKSWPYYGYMIMHFSRQGLAFQVIYSAWPHLPRTSTEPRRVVGSYFEIFHYCLRNVLDLGCYNPTRVELTTTNNSQFQ